MIYDFIPVSFIDYPGKIAATVFVSGCNFRCPYCHNSSLISVKEGICDKTDIFKYLKNRKGRIDGICITGGEPTLWKGLKNFIERVKALDLCVKLDTNGSRAEKLKELINEDLIDYIAMDIKAPLNKYGFFSNNESDISNVKQSVEIIKNSGKGYEFRTTVNEKILSIEDFISISKWLSPAKRYVLQGYKYNDDVLDKKLCGTKPCKTEFLEKIKKIFESNVQEVLIRV
jgi:pyruvate formate lyase activating enzyme